MIGCVLPWYGGKRGLAGWILAHLPPHRVYVEPFGGAMAVLLAKPPSPVEVYNDCDGDLVHFFRVVRDPRLFRRLYRRLLLTPYSRQEFQEAAERDGMDPVERAARWYVRVCQGFSAQAGLGGWCYSVGTSRRGMAGAVAKWLSRVEYLPALHHRLRRVQIEHDTWESVVDRYDTPETLFYVDPPYHPETLREKGPYTHVLAAADHERLVARLLRLRGMAALSGYDHPVYQPLEEAGWRKYVRTVACSAAGRTRGTRLRGEGAVLRAGQTRQECLWVGPPERVPSLLGQAEG